VSAEADMPRHDVEREIHSVGSSAATFGAQRLERRARELEHDCRAGRSFEEIDFHRCLVVLKGVLAETEQAFRSSYGCTDALSGNDAHLSREAGE
ncbi:MAG: Hpt domain-containing protein, partial [Rhodospirillaceae bacterium]